MTEPDQHPGTAAEDHFAWAEEIPENQWRMCQRVIEKARQANLRFSLGGAIAVANFTQRWRETKDLDFYILPPDRDSMVDVLSELGLQDYHEQIPYQRHWIYRAYREDTIVDLIWGMANGRDVVDEGWLTRGPEIEVRGEKLPIAPLEEMIWAKLYIVQKDRTDWPDIFNMIYAAGPGLDWGHLLERLGSDAPLIGSALNVFAWLSPGRAHELPKWLWKRLGLRKPEKEDSYDLTRQRALLLDYRPWFLPLLEEDKVER